MQEISQQYAFPFPYVWDKTQQVAKDYGAVCTPDFFGFNAQMELQYRGRLDASRKELVADATRDLFNAMVQVAKTGKGPANQIASMGCSIKWVHE
jgi:peroxiredoxin